MFSGWFFLFLKPNGTEPGFIGAVGVQCFVLLFAFLGLLLTLFCFLMGDTMRGSVFAFEAFLMAGGWLVFGEAQKLYLYRYTSEIGAAERSERSERMNRQPKLVLGTLKNMHSRNPRDSYR